MDTSTTQEQTTQQRINAVLDQIYSEVRRALELHAGMNSQHEAYAVILEELDEFWEQVKINPKKLSADDQERRLGRIHNELIQTAAMCVRSIIDLKL